MVFMATFLKSTYFYKNLKKMKLLLSFLLIFCSASLTAQVPDAATVLSKARKDAARSKKNVFVIFHASWCGWCHKMDNAMNEPEMKPLFEKNYVITHLTVLESADKKNLENPGADKILAQYGGDKGGIPFWYITDAKGNFIDDSKEVVDGKKGGNVGCPATEKEVDYFISVLKKSSSLNSEELASIRARFLKNK